MGKRPHPAVLERSEFAENQPPRNKRLKGPTESFTSNKYLRLHIGHKGMFCLLSLPPGNYLWIWHWGNTANSKRWKKSFLSCPQTRGECFPRYNPFFSRQLFYTTHTWPTFSSEFALCPCLSRLSQHYRAQPQVPCAAPRPSGRFQPALRGVAAPFHLRIWEIGAVSVTRLIRRSWAGWFSAASPARSSFGRN